MGAYLYVVRVSVDANQELDKRSREETSGLDVVRDGRGSGDDDSVTASKRRSLRGRMVVHT